MTLSACNLYVTWLKILLGALTSVGLIIFLLPWWPSTEYLVIPKYILLFFPRWWMIGVALCCLALAPFVCWKYRVLVILVALIALQFNDLRVNLRGNSVKKENGITVMSANIGAGVSLANLKQVINTHYPDIISFQEARKEKMVLVTESGYQVDCVSSQCIASKLPFVREQIMSRRQFGGWGSFATFYKFNHFKVPLYFINVHFNTPRSVIEDALNLDFNITQANKVDDIRSKQASLVQEWAEQRLAVVLAGDFNMPVEENIYHQNFSHYRNALSDAAFGFNYTKYTQWHGVRIDHILTSSIIDITSAQVLPPVGGDHRPIIATITPQI